MGLCRSQLDPHLQALADATAYRMLRFPHRFARKHQNYADNASILLLSRWSGKESFFKCGLLKHTCKNWKLCPYCCHKKRMEILSKFLPAFDTDEGKWGFFTLSFHRPHYCGDGYYDNLELIWDACRFGFEMMVDVGEFGAVFLLEEFQVLSYYPVPKVLAHVHAVVLADEITIGKTERLKEFVNNYRGWVKVAQRHVRTKALRDRLGRDLVYSQIRWMSLHKCHGIGMEVSTRTYEVRSEKDFVSILDYLVKPIDWSVKYVEEWHRYCEHDRDLGPWFNQNVDQVIDAWQFFSAGRCQHVYLGKAHHARTEFIGTPKQQRETPVHKRQIKILLEDCNEDRAFSLDDLAEPLEFGEGKAEGNLDGTNLVADSPS
jgi:hypothetical protein